MSEKLSSGISLKFAAESLQHLRNAKAFGMRVQFSGHGPGLEPTVLHSEAFVLSSNPAEAARQYEAILNSLHIVFPD